MSDCEPCRVAAGIGIAANICEELKGQVDCKDLEVLLDDPNATLADAQKAIEKMAEEATGKSKELLGEVVCIMKGECPIPSDSLQEPQTT